MANFSRSAVFTWNGDVLYGAGRVRAGTGAFDLAGSFPTLRGEAPHTTTPEEMLAASHAMCFGVGLRSLIARHGGHCDRVSVNATVTAQKTSQGIRIVSSHLDAVVVGLSGLNEGQLQAIAAAAEQGCTISNVLRHAVAITFAVAAK